MKWLADFSFFLIEEGEKLKALRNKVDMQFFLKAPMKVIMEISEELLVLHWLFKIHHVTENGATQCTWIV